MPSRVYSLDGLERTRLTSAACMPACAGLVVDPLPPPHEDDARLSSARRLRQGAGSRSAESGSGGGRSLRPSRGRAGSARSPGAARAQRARAGEAAGRQAGRPRPLAVPGLLLALPLFGRSRRVRLVALLAAAVRSLLLLAVFQLDEILLGDDHRDGLVVAGELDPFPRGRVAEHGGEALAGLGGRHSLAHLFLLG